MKKVLLFVVLAALLTVSGVFAQDMGVQLISPTTSTDAVSLDDLKIETTYEIDRYGIINPTRFEILDRMGQYEKGYTNTKGYHFLWHESGQEADFAILRIDITNLAKVGKDFLQNVSVKVVFDDEYEYSGWAYQFNYDNQVEHWGGFEEYKDNTNTEFFIAPEDNFKIESMYKGHYCFGCTLPNAIIESKKPLRMEISIDGNELIYNIHK